MFPVNWSELRESYYTGELNMCELCTGELSMCEFVPSAGEFDPCRGEVVMAKKPVPRSFWRRFKVGRSFLMARAIQ